MVRVFFVICVVIFVFYSLYCKCVYDVYIFFVIVDVKDVWEYVDLEFKIFKV